MVRTNKRKKKLFPAYNYSSPNKRFSNGNNDYWPANREIQAPGVAVGPPNFNYATYSRNRFPYKRTNFKNFKRYSRASSPVLGSAEHTAKKIQETSAIIMRHLLNPDENIFPLDKNLETEIANKESLETVVEEDRDKKSSPKPKDDQKTKRRMSYKIDEIHKKITQHLGKLTEGRKRNLINSDTSGYDLAIQHIMKQKRLEISRTLRNMCHKSSLAKDSSDLASSVNPDVGIKVEDLPQELIAELRGALNFDVEGYPEGTVGNCSEEILLNVLDNFIQELNSDSSNLDFFFGETDESQEKSETPSVSENLQTETVENIVKMKGSNEINADNIKKENNDVEEEFNKTENEQAKIKEEPAFDMQDHTIEINKEIVGTDSNNCIPKNSDNLNQVIGKNEVVDPGNAVISDNGKNIIDYNVIRTDCFENEIDTSSDSTSNISFLSDRHDNQVDNLVKSSRITSTLVQTDEVMNKISIEDFISIHLNEAPKSLKSAVDQMLQIDSWISQLTQYRQNLFKNVDSLSDQNVALQIGVDGHVMKKRKLNLDGNTKKLTKKKILKSKNRKTPYQFTEITDVVYFLKAYRNKLIAGTEKGQVFVLSFVTGQLLHTFNSSNLPIVSITCGGTYMFVASFNANLNVYDFGRYCEEFSHYTTLTLDYNVKCLENKWNYIFVGCSNGWLVRYSSKTLTAEFEDKFGDQDITVLKATQEGARRVLLVGSENSPIYIRDAFTGLNLRALTDAISSTSVYSIIIHKSSVYCAMINRIIMVFNFHDGNYLNTINVPGAEGTGCMAVKRNCVFVTYYMEDIHVYDNETWKCIDSIKGPGGSIVHMTLTNKQIIVATTSGKVVVIPIPLKILHFHSK